VTTPTMGQNLHEVVERSVPETGDTAEKKAKEFSVRVALITKWVKMKIKILVGQEDQQGREERRDTAGKKRE
jgi:hypothetical protein